MQPNLLPKMTETMRRDIEESLAKGSHPHLDHYRVCFLCGTVRYEYGDTRAPSGAVVDGWIGEPEDFSGAGCEKCREFERLHPAVYDFILRTHAFATLRQVLA
jgi:hypothetical protein